MVPAVCLQLATQPIVAEDETLLSSSTPQAQHGAVLM